MRFPFFFVFLLFPFAAFCSGVSYSVEFEGLENPAALKTIKTISQLVLLKKKPPSSMNALHYRAEADMPEILKVLQAHGYYEASTAVRIVQGDAEMLVIVTIDPGPSYRLTEYYFPLDVQCPEISLKNIGITLGKPALAGRIIDGELKLLALLAECGYPLASIESREIIADVATKTLRVRLDVEPGPRTRFGFTAIHGLRDVEPVYIQGKICWKKGDFYDSRKVEETRKLLMDSGLFSSVLITHPEGADGEGELSLNIEVAESKHQSVNLGVSYQTFWGPGITFGWEHRNISGLGRRLSIQGDITKKSHSGTATFMLSDFKWQGQDYIWEAIAMQEKIRAYQERSYSLANRYEIKLSTRLRLAVALKAERLFVTESVDNNIYTILEAPLYLRLSNSNSLLNPTKGLSLEYWATPAVAQIPSKRDFYLMQELVQSSYFPLTRSHNVVLAQKITFGMILSDRLSDVPVPKRFFGGSEENLRGYHFYTVSPLEGQTPIGGRSALFYTLEMRFRATQTIGLVPFFDMGNVYLTQLPTFKKKWFKSVGLGLRYFTFMGPFRVDIGFPLERRKGLDPAFRILVSIGQMF